MQSALSLRRETFSSQSFFYAEPRRYITVCQVRYDISSLYWDSKHMNKKCEVCNRDIVKRKTEYVKPVYAHTCWRRTCMSAWRRITAYKFTNTPWKPPHRK